MTTAWQNGPATIIELFEEQVRRTPQAPAVAACDAVLSYAELDARANRLARLLTARGAGPEQIVAVALPRSAEVVVALLGVLKTGAAYLPIDLSYPSRRIAFILADARPSCLIATLSTAERLGGATGAAGSLLTGDGGLAAATAAYPDTPLRDSERAVPMAPAQMAYVMYTSGSTGTPKAAVIEHRALGDYLDWALRTYPSLVGTSLWHASVSFDQTVTSLWGALCAGGQVLVSALADDGSPAAMPCHYLKATPSHLPLLDTLPERFSPTELLMLGGEALIGETLAGWRRRHPTVTVINVYGPTEVTVNCAEHVIAPGEPTPAGIVPLGRPMAGTQMHVLDAELRPVRPGTAGELYVSCAGLARGYLGHRP